MEPLFLILVLVIGLILVSILALASVWRALRQQQNAIKTQYPNAFVVSANFYGQESKRMSQMRGNGALVVTDDTVIFELLAPRRAYEIPIHMITNIEYPRSFLGKSRGTKLLKISFMDAHGDPEAMAWEVPDVDAVVASIQDH